MSERAGCSERVHPAVILSLSQCGWISSAGMDISVLPNNNHPEKFLQLDVGMLPATHGMFQVGAVMSSQRYWQNRVYSQVRTGLNTYLLFVVTRLATSISFWSPKLEIWGHF